jgi:hypothetical protein
MGKLHKWKLAIDYILVDEDGVITGCGELPMVIEAETFTAAREIACNTAQSISRGYNEESENFYYRIVL